MSYTSGIEQSLLTGLFQGFEMLMYYFVCSEIGVANFLHRHFDWSANSLWYEEIPHAKDPSRSMFVLGGKDFIVNSDVCGTFSLVRGAGVLTRLFYSASLNTLNLTVLRRAYYTPPNTHMVKHLSVALTSLNRSWTGLRNLDCRFSPYPLTPELLHRTF